MLSGRHDRIEFNSPVLLARAQVEFRAWTNACNLARPWLSVLCAFWHISIVEHRPRHNQNGQHITQINLFRFRAVIGVIVLV